LIQKREEEEKENFFKEKWREVINFSKKEKQLFALLRFIKPSIVQIQIILKDLT